MSKKMMKRTAALSALIAISLSGTVMAADQTVNLGSIYPSAQVDVAYEATDLIAVEYSIYDKHSSTINLKSGGDTTVGGLVSASASKSKIDIVSAGDTTIGSDVTSSGGAVINITSGGTTTINGAVSISNKNGGGDKINIGGKSIIIDAGNDWGVSVRGGYYGFSKETAVNIGTADTESITIKANDIGLISQYEHADINVYGDKLNLEVSGDGAYGIYTGNNSDAYTPTAEVNVYSDQTKITMTGADSSAVVAFSDSTLNIHGGLEASGDNAILVRGQSTVNINQAGTGVVKLDGDIEFNNQYGTSPHVSANNTVNINLTTEDSYLNGKVYVSNASISAGGTVQDKDDVGTGAHTGLTLGLSNGATWNVTDDSFANTLNVNNGNIVMEGKDKTLSVDNLKGNGGTVTTDSLTNQIVADSNSAKNMTVKGTDVLTKQLEESGSDVNQALNKLAQTVDGGESVATVELAEGALLGATTATFGANGVTNVITKENISNAGLIDMTALSFMAWRGENDDLNERLGDLRSAKQDRGLWTRMSRAQQSYNTVTNQYNMYQIGYDQQAGDWTLGAAYSYTDGKSWFEKGTGENTHNVFSLYGTKMNNNGSFIDVVAKYGNLDYEYTLAGGVGDGDYDTDAYSFSVETGKRITSSNGAWVEPQLQLTYGTVDDVAFATKNGYSVNMDSADSFVARAGIMAGKPVHKGNIYLKASYLYDFAGEVEGTFSNGTRSVDISRDLGGGWWEVGAGANFNLSDATQLYLDFEKAIAGEAEVEWKWNAGVRYSF